MRYRDFVIQLGASGEGRYVAQVLLSSQGRVSWELDLPFSPAELRSIHRAMEESVQQRKGGAADRHVEVVEVGDSRPHLTSQTVGARLFRTLLSEESRPIFERELALAQRERQGLRLRLKIDLGQRDLLALYNLPWELLYNPDTHDFLGLSGDIAIVRYLDVNRPDATIKRPRRLRILAVMSTPAGRDFDPLDLEREWESLRQRVAGPSLDLVPLRHATRESLYQALGERDFHILHFMGHGALRDGDGCIVLETADGRADPVRGASLAQDLRDRRALQMVVLNACDTADASFEATSPFEGVATALILGGIPAVVGMRYPISDSAAVAFSEHFYRELAAGEPIDAAVAKGRQAIFRIDDESFEWAKPILFLRSKEGEIWPSKAWSRIKKMSLAALTISLVVLLGLIARLPAVRHFLKIQLSAEGRMSRGLAANYWRRKFASCEGANYALVRFSPPDGPESVSLVQLKGLHWPIEPVEVNEAARLDGTEFLARSTARFSSLRSAEAPRIDWSAWSSPKVQPFVPAVVVSKVKGQWLVTEGSPHVAGGASSGHAELLAFDCHWLQGGKLDAGKLKEVSVDAAADVEKGDLEHAETKILVGLAWTPDDPDLLMLFANLRLAQAMKEPVLARREALRREAFKAGLAAVKIATARRPDGAQLLAQIEMMESAAEWLCKQARQSEGETRANPLSILFAPQLNQLDRLMQEAGGCE